MAKLSLEEEQVLERGALAKDFIESDFFTKHLAPELKRKVSAELPEPKGPEWQDLYRNLFAMTKAMGLLDKTLKGWVSEYIMLRKKQSEEEDEDEAGEGDFLDG